MEAGSLIVFGLVQAISLIYQDWLVKRRANALSEFKNDGSRYKALSNDCADITDARIRILEETPQRRLSLYSFRPHRQKGWALRLLRT